MGGAGVSALGGLFSSAGSAASGLFGAAGGALEPDIPDLPKKPKRFLEDERREAERAADRRRTRARGSFGIGDTALTGPQGLAPGGVGKAPQLGTG